MKVYTVVKGESSTGHFLDEDVLGSFVDKDRAESEMADWIVRLADVDRLFAVSLWDDDNHEDFQTEIQRACGLPLADVQNFFERGPDDHVLCPVELEKAMRDFVRNEIEAVGEYCVCSSVGNLYHFYVFPNYVEGA